MPKISERVARRLDAQLLSGAPAGSRKQSWSGFWRCRPKGARGARLAIRSRSRGLTAADLDARSTERRSLVITWLNRGTLHLVAADDYWWLHPLTTPQIATTSRRRLEQEA